jgi:hypothetical protein
MGFISVLESENEAFKQQVKKLHSILPPRRVAMIEKQSPFNIINMQKQKGKFLLHLPLL